MTRRLRYVTGLLLTACALAPLSLRGQAAPVPPAPASPPVPAAGVAAAPVVPPADAVALCRDGTFIVEPGTAAGCEARGGLLVAMPRRVPPPAPVAAAPAQSVDAERERAAATPPAGATMRCKDGTWLTGVQDASRCANAGGVAMLVTQPIAPPPARP
jgi:hypothetical protein